MGLYSQSHPVPLGCSVSKKPTKCAGDCSVWPKGHSPFPSIPSSSHSPGSLSHQLTPTFCPFSPREEAEGKRKTQTLAEGICYSTIFLFLQILFSSNFNQEKTRSMKKAIFRFFACSFYFLTLYNLEKKPHEKSFPSRSMSRTITVTTQKTY